MKQNKQDACKFCGIHVDLDNEGVTYKDGTCAHESCDDSHNYQCANAADFGD